jgi:hypothetical protein
MSAGTLIIVLLILLVLIIIGAIYQILKKSRENRKTWEDNYLEHLYVIHHSIAKTWVEIYQEIRDSRKYVTSYNEGEAQAALLYLKQRGLIEEKKSIVGKGVPSEETTRYLLTKTGIIKRQELFE